MTQPAAPEAPPAPVESSAPEPDKGWEAESYAWSPDPVEESPAPPAAPETTPPPSAPPPTPDDAAPAASLDALIAGELTDEQIEALAQKNPKLRERIDRLANARFGNLKQQLDADARKQAAADADWAEDEKAYGALTALETSNKAEYDRQMRLPEVQRWLGYYQGEKAKRAAPATPDESTLRAQVREAEIQSWNVEAAGAFGQTVKAAVPFYADLPSDLRGDLENVRQKTDGPWLDEYMDRLTKGFIRWHESELEAARETGRNEGRAAGGGPGPVAINGNGDRGELSVQEIIKRHSEYGYDPERGVTEEQHAYAKKAKGWD